MKNKYFIISIVICTSTSKINVLSFALSICDSLHAWNWKLQAYKCLTLIDVSIQTLIIPEIRRLMNNKNLLFILFKERRQDFCWWLYNVMKCTEIHMPIILSHAHKERKRERERERVKYIHFCSTWIRNNVLDYDLLIGNHVFHRSILLES